MNKTMRNLMSLALTGLAIIAFSFAVYRHSDAWASGLLMGIGISIETYCLTEYARLGTQRSKYRSYKEAQKVRRRLKIGAQT